MKYSAHCYIFTERWSDSQLDLLDTAHDLGLDGFEIAVGDDVAFDARLTRRRAESLGLELAISPGGRWPYECDLSSPDADHRQRGLVWHKRQVDVGAALGVAAYTGALYGHPGTLRYRPLTVSEIQYTAEGLWKLAEYGQTCGVQIVIEPMSHFRTHVVNNAEQAVALIAEAAHPNLSMLLDTYHLISEVRDYRAQILAARDRLWGLHACENDRGVPGSGLVPWQVIFQALRDIAFDGHMVFESYNSAIGKPPGYFAFQRGMMHNVCSDGNAFVKAGMAFLKDGLQQTTPELA